MVCVLCGIQRVDFTADDGKEIKGNKLHVVSDQPENNQDMNGKRCASIFTKLDLTGLKIGGKINLLYDQPLGSKTSRLVDIQAV